MKSLEYDISYKFRALEPILPVHKVVYPCLVPDDKNPGQLRQSWRSIRLPLTYKPLGWQKQPTVVDMLRQIDLEIRKQNRPVGVTEEIKSFFDPQKLWVIPVFDRRDSEPQIKFLEAGWTITNAIRLLRNQPDEDDPQKLAFGPHWVHDIVIRKIKKEGNQREKFKTTYTVHGAKNNPFAGQFDKAILEPHNLDELEKNSVELGIFTDVEYGVLQMFSEEAEMFPLYQPQSPEDIAEQLAIRAPLCLDALNNDHVMIFPDPQEFADALNRQQISHGSIAGGLVQIQSGRIAAEATPPSQPAPNVAPPPAQAATVAPPAAAAATSAPTTAPTQPAPGSKLAGLMGGKKQAAAAKPTPAAKPAPASAKPAPAGSRPAFVEDFASEGDE
jgi:hypothetical protein